MRLALTAILLIVGAAAIAAGALYLTQPAHSLPTFFPGYGAHIHGKYLHRGDAGVGLGVVLVLIALVVGVTAVRRRGRLGAATTRSSAGYPLLI